MLINVGREYCFWVNVGFPFVNPIYEAVLAYQVVQKVE